MEFDLFRIGVTMIGIFIVSIVMYLQHDTFKGSYKGSLYLILLGVLLLFFGVARIYNLNENVSIRLIIDFLLFKIIGTKGGDDLYCRAVGYILFTVGVELFVLTLQRRKRLKNNK